MSAQSEANQAALEFACHSAAQLALLANPDATEFIINGVPVFAPNLIPPYSSPPRTRLFYNGPQTCAVPCPGDVFFSFTTPPGRFAGANQAQADSIALSYACQQAQLRKVCPSTPCTITTDSPLPEFDQGQSYSKQITVSGGIAPIVFSIISGSLPSGLSMSASGLISGTATLVNGNLDAAFTVRATDSANPPNTCSKVFSLPIIDYCGLSFTKRFRLKNYVDFVLGPCLCAPSGLTPWDGTFDAQIPIACPGSWCKFNSSVGQAGSSISGVTPQGLFLTTENLSSPGSCGEWQIQLNCNLFGNPQVIWQGTKVGSNAGAKLDSAAGIYSRSSGCDLHATLEVEEYTP